MKKQKFYYVVSGSYKRRWHFFRRHLSWVHRHDLSCIVLGDFGYLRILDDCKKRALVRLHGKFGDWGRAKRDSFTLNFQ